MEDRCVCCGEIIPEGAQVCPKCLVASKKKTELKPCPFCGSPVEFRGVPGERTMIRCTNEQCYMFYPTAFTSWHNGDTEEHARLRLTTWWNRRADDGK